jgi:hypothetical protein
MKQIITFIFINKTHGLYYINKATFITNILIIKKERKH